MESGQVHVTHAVNDTVVLIVIVVVVVVVAEVVVQKPTHLHMAHSRHTTQLGLRTVTNGALAVGAGHFCSTLP